MLQNIEHVFSTTVSAAEFTLGHHNSSETNDMVNDGIECE